MSKIIKNHGKTFLRTGTCLRCGVCGCEKLGCLHFKWEDSLATCTIYNDKKRDAEICGECTEYMSEKFGKEVTINHKTCKDFPGHPDLNVIKTGICGYKFKEIK